MTLTQLLHHVGDENIGVQFLTQCITDAKNTKHDGTKITFCTDAITITDIAMNTGKIGVIVWVPRDKWPTAEEISALSSPVTVSNFSADTPHADVAQSADARDAARYRWLRDNAYQMADCLGPLFRIDVRRSGKTLFNFGLAVDAAMQGKEGEE